MTRSVHSSVADPHADQPVLTAGPAAEKAAGTLILVHGRGASAASMLPLYEAFGFDDLAVLAPQAAGHTWYPQSFLAPLEQNQPYLDSALGRIDAIVSDLLARGIASERIAILGFSQGACLTTEYAARHPRPRPRRYGAIMGLSGGLIGPPGMPRSYPGSLSGTPVFLGSGDPDPHVPFARVRETEAVFTRMGARVDLRRYPGMPHTISEEELLACRDLLSQLTADTSSSGQAW